ncbi:unnamed protein product [Hanseniaspora opuntiae]
MFMKGEFDFANPANNSSGVTGVYRRVMKQIGCCLFYKNANFLTKFKLANEGLTLKHFIANFWFDKKDTVSLLLCTSAKTAALGVAIMTSEYGADKERIGQLLVPLVLYQSEQVIVANFQTTFFKRWISKGDGDEEFAERYIEEREERAQLVNEKRSVTSDSSN